MSTWAWILIIIILVIAAIAITYFMTRRSIEKQLRANPPISEAQIRAMFLSMGRKPSEQQIRQVMHQMKAAGNKENKYKKRK